jgi:hypothetical protein
VPNLFDDWANTDDKKSWWANFELEIREKMLIVIF